MSDTPYCDECERRIRSRIGRRFVDGTHQFCNTCFRKIRTERLTPGDDFAVGELWTTDDEDKEAEK